MPRWLGSVARRGDPQAHGAGWSGKDEEDAAQPRWLGSVARREGSHTSGAGWVDPEEAEKPRWLGSVARRGDQRHLAERAESDGGSAQSLYLVDLEAKGESTGEQSAETPASEWQGSGGRARLNEAREPEPVDEVGERRTRYVVGALGMRLRVVA